MESELKYIVPNNVIESALKLVQTTCEKDASFPSAQISSIYFDTLTFDFLDEKINSDYLKTKLRLRWYKHLESGTLSESAFLEIKNKIGGLRSKQRCVSQFSPQQLDDIDLDSPKLLNSNVDFAKLGFPYEKPIFPALVVQYNRQRFVDPVTGCRISIDSDICCPKHNKQLIPGAIPSLLQSAIIELKGDMDIFPPGLLPLFKLGLRKSSFSKYLACYARIKNMIYDPR